MYYFLYSAVEFAYIPFKVISVISFYLLNALVMLWAKSMFPDKRAIQVYSGLTFTLIMVIPAIFGGMLILLAYSDVVMVGAPFGAEMIQRLYFLIVPISVVHEHPSESLTCYLFLTNILIMIGSIGALLFVKNKNKNW
jgi:hypothetical protein